MRRNWLAILFLVLLSSSVSRSTARETKEITCTGKVMDSKARPLAGAEVAAFEKFYDSSGQEYTKILGQVKKTDVNGYFVLNADISSQRNVFIVARKKGMAVGWDILNSGSFYNTSYNTKGNFLIILEKPGTLAGTVVDEMDNPIAGAKVRALPKTSYLSRLDQKPILAPEQWFTTQTDAKGKFSFNNFAADVSCDFWVEASGWASVYKYTTCYLSSCGFAVGRTDVRLVLLPEAPIQGRVVEVESDNPIAGVSLLIQPENIREHLNPYCPDLVVSGQDGQFSFEGIPAGKHLLKVISPEKEMAKWVGKSVKLDVQQGQATKDVIIEVEKGGIIETVVREGATKKPLHNIRVVAYNESSSGRAWTNAEGVARIRVPPGEFNFYASGEGYSSYRANEPITVAKGQTTQLEILLDRNPGASGVVLDESGRPVAGALVRAHPTGDEVLTGSNGRFEFEIGFDQKRPCKYLFAQYVERNLAAIVEIRDDSKPMKATLKPALSIAGQITDANGVGIPAARFSLFVHSNNYLSRFGSEVLADAKGKYQMRAIPPGQSGFYYRISVNASGYGRKELERISITGEPGTPMEMKIMLQPADQSISGVVVNAEGKPAARVPIFLSGRDQPKRSTATNNNGRFTIKRICKGQLRLQANFSSSPGGSGTLQAQGGDKDVKIILGQRLVHTKYVSLTSKPLPELKDLKIDLSLANVSDKMILVCFWDMEQRPSRYCIRQLAKQAQQLKQKGVAVVAVQASKIDENKLNEWLKKYNIPFPVGMVQGDVEKTRFAWGVKSLPWLILTNWEQTVIAEGFGIDELDEELKKNIDTEHAIQKNKATPTKPVAQTGLSDTAKSFLDAEAILAGWESSYAGIRTMRVSYCTRLVDYQPPANTPDEPPPVKYQHVERVEDGKRYHIRYSIAEDGFDRPECLMEHAFDGKITREYSARGKHGSIVAGLIGRNTETMNDLKVYMLLRRRLVGGRNASGTYLIEDPNSKPDLSRTLGYVIPRSMVSVLPKLESVGSQSCHVIEVTVPGKDHKGIPRQIKQVFWMAHDKGMCLMKYQWYWDNTLDREIEVEQIAVAKMDSTNVWYPKKAYRTIFSDEFGTAKYELTVTEFIPNVEVDGKTFRFDFPKGTYVFDRIRGISGVDLPKEPPSLLGKSLPRLKDFNLKLNADQSKDKMILACFWDMEQRPSRNCIMRLAKQAEQLKQRGVTIVVIQASKVDESTLNDWLKEYNIPFTIRIVQSDVEKTKFDWGVKSLPWLILTNRKHIVRAEGFALTEIDEKISAIAQKQN